MASRLIERSWLIGDYGNATGRGVVLQPLNNLQAHDVRHGVVGQDPVGPAGRREDQARLATRRQHGDDVTDAGPGVEPSPERPESAVLRWSGKPCEP